MAQPGRDCCGATDGAAALRLPGEVVPTRDPGPVARARVALNAGKVLYDGRSLVAWASRVADRIVERCDASRVVLYGSVARGDDGPDSDIDLLVVMPIIGGRHEILEQGADDAAPTLAGAAPADELVQPGAVASPT